MYDNTAAHAQLRHSGVTQAQYSRGVTAGQTALRALLVILALSCYTFRLLISHARGFKINPS